VVWLYFTFTSSIRDVEALLVQRGVTAAETALVATQRGKISVPTDHFGFTKLVVADLERSAEFYKSVCGLLEQARVDADIDGKPIREILFNATGTGAATFVLLTFPGAPRPQAGGVILGFITTDVDAFLARAQQAGGAVVETPIDRKEHGVRVGFVTDIERNLIEVVQLL
jgi:predicted enzyme related to lactoylglutathione lyase